MDILFFFQLLMRRKWLIVLPAIVGAVLTFMLVQSLPKKYLSAARLSTGIVDFKSIKVGNDNPFVQQFQIDGRFSNLIEQMMSAPSVKMMARELLLHDLKNPAEAFHTPDWSKSKIFDASTLSNYA
jgi:uncharacterized protein involved in exopolysaccharide biosynthesis